MTRKKAKQLLKYMPKPVEKGILVTWRGIYNGYRNMRTKYQYHYILFNLKIQQISQRSYTETPRSDYNYKIIIRNKDQIQQKIDSLDYPPTHEYELPLKPIGITKIRLEQFNVIDKEFFYGENFLDIGSNKGFFSLLATKHFNKIISIEPDHFFTDVTKQMIQHNQEIINTSFRNFTTDLTFDKILLGNVAHYLFRETGGWEWIKKLACYSTGLVMIEGAVDMSCKDMTQVIKPELRKEFDNFMGRMSEHFILVKKIPSQLEDRYVMLFQKKNTEKKIDFADLKIKKVVKNHTHSTIMILENDQIAKLVRKKQNPLMFPIKKNNINIATMSPISNGLVCGVYHNGEFTGWIEKYEQLEIYEYKENQKHLFKLLCQHTVFLAKIGYIDADCGIINFFKGTNQIFDKGMVKPIKDLTNVNIDNYFTYLNDSYDLDLTLKEKIRYALISKDSEVIEAIFTEIQNEVR